MLLTATLARDAIALAAILTRAHVATVWPVVIASTCCTRSSYKIKIWNSPESQLAPIEPGGHLHSPVRLLHG